MNGVRRPPRTASAGPRAVLDPHVAFATYSGPLLTQQAFGPGVSEVFTKPLQSRETAITLARVLHRNSAGVGPVASRRGDICDLRAAVCSRSVTTRT